MKPSNYLWHVVFGATLLGSMVAWAQSPTGQPPAHAIPYKTEPGVPDEQGLKAGVVLLLLLVAAGGGLYAVRKKMPKLAGILGTTGRLQVVDTVRLDQRSRVYLIRLDGQEILVAQSGDRLLQLIATGTAPAKNDVPPLTQS